MQRHGDHDDRHHVRDGPVARPEQLVEEPDRQCALFAGGEYGDDDFVEGQRECQHAAGEERGRDFRRRGDRRGRLRSGMRSSADLDARSGRLTSRQARSAPFTSELDAGTRARLMTP